MITQGKVTEIFYITDNCCKLSDNRMMQNILHLVTDNITNKRSFTLSSFYFLVSSQKQIDK